MAKNKKKILFDVLGEVFEPQERSAAASRRRSDERTAPSRRPRGGEVRLTTSMATTIAVAMLVVLACAYWFGLVHGRGAAERDDAGRFMSASLRRDVGGRETWGPHYAVLATSARYMEYTRDALLDEFLRYRNLLVDAGYDVVDIWDQPDEEGSGGGRLLLWVGRGDSVAALDDEAARIRELGADGEWPFASAFPTLFRERL